jgi:hypothetical protein
MAEYVPHALHVQGHIPNTDTAMLELYRLLTIFLASKSIAELRTGHGESFDAISHVESLGDDEITRILLAVAITARVIDDRDGRILDLVAGPCGKLVTFADDEEIFTQLSLREACNKIIHAQKVHFDVSKTKDDQPYLNPSIYLYGTLHKKKWKAILDVVAFIKEYCTCVRYG